MFIAVAGVVFAVVLVSVEVGMLLSLAQNASLLIDLSRADLWVCAKDVKTFEFATPIPRRKKYAIETVPGVAHVEEFNVSVSNWKRPDGGRTSCQLVGVDLRGQLAPSFLLRAGSLDELRNRDAVVIDSSSYAKLGRPQIGDYAELLNTRAKVVGFTEDIKSFSTMPYAITSLKRAGKYSLLGDAERETGAESSIYFLVKVRKGWDLSAVQKSIAEHVGGIEVFTPEAFSWKTQRYWLFETGIGLGFLIAGVLGMFVGGVIVSQILYSMTIDKLAEYGVLKALGTSMFELAQIVLSQALICGVVGFMIGYGLSLLLGYFANQSGTGVMLPPILMGGVGLMSLLLCSASSLISINRLRRLEPALVFRC